MTITKHTDLAVFMGQSNMAGRGNAAESPVCRLEAGAEYRSVSAPGRLYPITEPFGREENRPGGIHDGTKKTGSMVSSFANEYFRRTGHFLTAVSASQGGTTSAQWADCLARDAAHEDVIAVADFMGYLEHMADPYHYDQFAYNAIGRTAAEHAAAYLDGCRCR